MAKCYIIGNCACMGRNTCNNSVILNTLSLGSYIFVISISQNYVKQRDRDQNLFTFEGGRAISACQISGHYLHAFSWECPEIQNLTRFTMYFGLCDLGIWQMTLKKNHLVTWICKLYAIWLRYWSEKCDGRRDRQADGQAVRHAVFKGLLVNPSQLKHYLNHLLHQRFWGTV